MTCKHNSINIYPTLENSWNLSDTFTVECHHCKSIVLNNTALDQIINYILNNKCTINSGSKYLPQTMNY